MSTIHVPDPHPGRCLNVRPQADPNNPHTPGRMVRCLELDASEHVCRFPAAPVKVSGDWGAYQILSERKPTPWVVPPKVES